MKAVTSHSLWPVKPQSYRDQPHQDLDMQEDSFHGGSPNTRPMWSAKTGRKLNPMPHIAILPLRVKLTSQQHVYITLLVILTTSVLINTYTISFHSCVPHSILLYNCLDLISVTINHFLHLLLAVISCTEPSFPRL